MHFDTRTKTMVVALFTLFEKRLMANYFTNMGLCPEGQNVPVKFNFKESPSFGRPKTCMPPSSFTKLP